MGSSRIPRPEDKAEPITQQNRWDTAGFGGDSDITEPPHSLCCCGAPDCPVSHCQLQQTAFLSVSSFYLCPATVSHPPEASLMLWQLLQAVAL